jgi:enoyl-CoA hydratase/carnithine racemase
MIEVEDSDRVRLVRLNRPRARNAMNEMMWDGTAEAFIAAATDPAIAVVVLTGVGEAFSAGEDMFEMAAGADGTLTRGRYGFSGLANTLVSFPKPFLCAINGMGVGFGATVVGLADLVFMSSSARLKCPFSDLGIAPELASTVTFPELAGRQRAMWALLSSEWLSAEQCREMGLAFAVCPPDQLMGVTMDHARLLAAKPISSLVATKRLVLDGMEDRIRAALEREGSVLGELIGGAANREALRAFGEKRPPDFSRTDREG